MSANLLVNGLVAGGDALDENGDTGHRQTLLPTRPLVNKCLDRSVEV